MIFKILEGIFTKKWADQFVPGQVETAMNQWAIGLAGLNQDQIQHAIDQCRMSLDWPPSIAKFRALATEKTESVGPAYQQYTPTLTSPINAENVRSALQKIKSTLKR